MYTKIVTKRVTKNAKIIKLIMLNNIVILAKFASNNKKILN